jgi:riboflavin-specific deaminase-like protein
VFPIPVETWLSNAEEYRIRTGRPFVTLSWAQSMDGSISTRRGIALGLSGQESLLMTHYLRTIHDAIVVGIGTVLSDDPQLTVRLVDGKNSQVIVLDSKLSFPEQARLLDNPKPPWIASTFAADQKKEAYLASRGARVLHLQPDSTGQVELLSLMDKLANLEVNSIFVEGGARVITSFLQCRLVDHVIVTIAPLIVGGLDVVEELLSPMPRLQEFNSIHLGEDLIVWGTPEW